MKRIKGKTLSGKGKMLIFTVAVFFAISATLLGFGLTPNYFLRSDEALAQSPPFGVFGGVTVSRVFCTCNNPPTQVLMYVSPPVPAPVMYTPGVTIEYAFYQLPRLGIWVLGIYVPGPIPCYVRAGKLCYLAGTAVGGIYMLGTSM